MKYLLSAGLLSAAAIAGATTPASEVLTEVNQGKLPTSDCGIIRRFSARSATLDADFTVDIWLPDNYNSASEERYPVVYMHDGQNLFDPTLSYAGAAWEVEQTLGMLIENEWIEAPIVVGIHNRGTLRPSDYIPEKPAMEYISEADREASGMWKVVNNKFYGDEYMRFIAMELKPAVDRMFATRTGATDTFIMGSSMGGLASIYAMCEYPDVFGGVACLSTHWIGNFEQESYIYPSAMLAYLEDHLPSADTHRIYLDRGTVDLDSYYESWEERARDLVRAKGYSEATDNLYVFTDNGASHTEVYWAQRVDRPLHFLLKSSDRPYTPFSPGVQEFHVIYQDEAHSWAQPRAFAWAPGVVHLGNWPGTPMTPVIYGGRPAWEIRFSHVIAPTQIIFDSGKSGSSQQTSDLEFRNNSVYGFSGIAGLIDDESGVATSNVADGVSVAVKGGRLVINSVENKEIMIYSSGGRSLRLRIHEGVNEIQGLSPGVYIVEGQKVIIP